METINKLVQHHRSITSQFKLLHDSDSGRLSDGERVKARREQCTERPPGHFKLWTQGGEDTMGLLCHLVLD